MRGDELFAKGAVIIVTKGSYSDYSIQTTVKALKDFTAADIQRDCVKVTKHSEHYSSTAISLDMMVEKGFVKELPPTREINLDDWRPARW